jgi:hypothetical protein
MRQQTAVHLLLILTAASSLVAACGGGSDDRPGAVDSTPPPPINTGDGDGDGDGDMGDGDAGDGDTGDGDGDVAPDPDEFNLPGAPVVEIEVAEEYSDDTLFAVCTVQQSEEEMSDSVDVETIEILLLDGEGDEIASAVPMGTEDGVYEGEIPLSTIEPGEYTVRCVAADTGDPPKFGMAEVAGYVDHGPMIEVLGPEADSFLSAAAEVNLEFQISPVALFEDDLGAEVKGDVDVIIGGNSFVAVPKAGEAGVYWIEGLDLDDPMDFPSGLPDGSTLVTVRASNDRGIEAEYTFSLTIDGVGPVVEVVSPDFGDVIGDAVTFVFEITDEYSGVDWSTLQVELGSDDVLLFTEDNGDQWARDGSTVTLTIQTTEYGGSRDLSFNVSVRDTVGNDSTGAATGNYRLDHFGPYLSLDPPNFRRHVSDDGTCSHSFDPLGDRSIEPGETVLNFGWLRALVWDRANGDDLESDQGLFYYSGVNDSTVKLWISRADSGEELVVDATGAADGTACTEINLDGTQAQFVDMLPIAPKGTPYLGDGTGDEPVPALDRCGGVYAGTATMTPALLCESNASELTVVPAHSHSPTEPIIYAFAVEATTEQCTGGDIEIRNYITDDYEGWACAAMEAEDYVGNRTVSLPLAFCYDNSRVPGEPACASAPETAPSCTDGCTVPEYSYGDWVYDWTK